MSLRAAKCRTEVQLRQKQHLAEDNYSVTGFRGKRSAARKREQITPKAGGGQDTGSGKEPAADTPFPPTSPFHPEG